MKRKLQRTTKLAPPWLAYTDLLSSTLMILMVALVTSSIGKLANEKPPIIRLSDDADFRFTPGSYSISRAFARQLATKQLPGIQQVIKCYGIDTIEIIGHTDSTPNSGGSNLDAFRDNKLLVLSSNSAISGSNADLGLLRALSVENLLKNHLSSSHKHLQYRSYSASSFIDPEEIRSELKAKPLSYQQAKRRIEIRFTRSNKARSMPRC
jgi:outer membrane protein OmpA-like peptidoglycan-associated protein